MKKHLKYLEAVLKHKWFVFTECLKTGYVPLLWRGIVHDWHKFLPSEWFPYAENFYGEKTEKVKHDFVVAMNHHMARAKHHWNYWIWVGYKGELIILEMPRVYALEMICDWIAASKAYSGKSDCLEWYHANKDNIILHEKTRNLIEALINYEDNEEE